MNFLGIVNNIMSDTSGFLYVTAGNKVVGQWEVFFTRAKSPCEHIIEIGLPDRKVVQGEIEWYLEPYYGSYLCHYDCTLEKIKKNIRKVIPDVYIPPITEVHNLST